MAKVSSVPSVEAIVAEAVGNIFSRTLQAVEKALTSQIAVELGPRRSRSTSRDRGARRRRRRSPAEMTMWIADNRARRVPNFVIEMTGGLDTKKKIVARYGHGAVFEKDKPLPPSAGAPTGSSVRRA